MAGAVLAGMDLDWLSRHLAEKGEIPATALAVIDRNGVFLVREPDPEQWVGTKLPERLKAQAQARSPRVGEYTGLDGILRIGAIVPIAFGPDPDLLVVIGLSKQAALAVIERATRRDVGLIAIGLMLAVLAA